MAAPANNTVVQRVYTCQSCKKTNTDAGLFKLVRVGRVGFVICKDCWD